MKSLVTAAQQGGAGHELLLRPDLNVSDYDSV